MNIERIPLDKIDASGRLRPVDPDQVLLIAASAAEDGIRTPIEVRPAKAKGSYLLVVGAHRFSVAQLLGHPEIPAIVLPKMTDDEARMREIDENVYRHDLSDLDRAVFLAEKKVIYERLHPHTQHGKGRSVELAAEQVAIFGDLSERFTAEIQERLGYSERTIQRIVARARIAPDVRERLIGTAFTRNGSELDALAKLEANDQRLALDMVLSDDPEQPRKFATAVALIKGKAGEAVRSEDDIQWGALNRAWRQCGARARRRFIQGLIDEADPFLTEAIRHLEEAA